MRYVQLKLHAEMAVPCIAPWQVILIESGDILEFDEHKPAKPEKFNVAVLNRLDAHGRW